MIFTIIFFTRYSNNKFHFETSIIKKHNIKSIYINWNNCIIQFKCWKIKNYIIIMKLICIISYEINIYSNKKKYKTNNKIYINKNN